LSAFVTFLFLAYRLFYEGRAVGAPKKKRNLSWTIRQEISL